VSKCLGSGENACSFLRENLLTDPVTRTNPVDIILIGQVQELIFLLARSNAALVQCVGRKKRFVNEDPVTGEQVSVNIIEASRARYTRTTDHNST
jgi:hypothetical protein